MNSRVLLILHRSGLTSVAILLPIDDDEIRFKRRIEVSEKAHLWEPWSAVKKNQKRIGDAYTSDHHPLIELFRSET